jgi:hypothetical protein
LRKPSPATVIAMVALFVALGGLGVAATGGNFILGRQNTASNTSDLSSNVTTGPTLQVTNSGGKTAAKFNASGPPFAVSNAKRIQNLNADQLDGKDSAAFLPSSGDIVRWYSPYDYRTPQAAVGISPSYGPTVNVTSSTAGPREVYIPLDAPQTIFGTTLKLKSVTICFNNQGAPITGTLVGQGQGGASTTVYSDTYTHSSPEDTCYDVAPTTPAIVSGSLYVRLYLYYASSSDRILLYAVKAVFGT